MAKGGYIGINNTARKIKKGYIGVSNIARKIKKAYMGVGGVARPCWSGGEVEYYGTITPLPANVDLPAVGNTTSYVVFAGGGSRSNAVAAYNKSLTRTIATNLPNGALDIAGEYSQSGAQKAAVFAGGLATNPIKTVVRYDDSLTQTLLTEMDYSAYRMGSAPVSGYSVFAGGYAGSTTRDEVYAYNYSGTKTKAANLSSGRYFVCGASNPSYAVFAGGYRSTVVEAYDSGLTKKSCPSLDATSNYNSGGTVAGLAIVAGGQNQSKVYAYDQSLSKTLLTNLTYSSNYHMACGYTENNIIFAGGRRGSDAVSNAVDVYDSSLVKKPNLSLSRSLKDASGGSIGDYILIAGGNTASVGNNYSNVIDVFIA